MVAHLKETTDRSFQGSGIARNAVGLALDVPHDLNPTPKSLIGPQVQISARFSPWNSAWIVKDLGEGELRLVQIRKCRLESRSESY